ncbi:MAG: nitroreductase [Desulfomonilaceae bacterium]
MEFNDVVLDRRSIRAFLADPVPRKKVTRAVQIARWAPSWGNTQPWEVVVADGSKVQELARLFQDEAKKGMPPRPDIEMPVQFPEEPHMRRYRDLGRSLFTAMGIDRNDAGARAQHYLNMYNFFGAPTVLYLLIDNRLNEPYSCLDLGSFGTTFCYAARQEGLGTIYLAASMHFPDIARKVLELPEDKKVVIGIAVGFPNPDAPGGLFRSDRDSIEIILRFA